MKIYYNVMVSIVITTQAILAAAETLVQNKIKEEDYNISKPKNNIKEVTQTNQNKDTIANENKENAITEGLNLRSGGLNTTFKQNSMHGGINVSNANTGITVKLHENDQESLTSKKLLNDPNSKVGNIPSKVAKTKPNSAKNISTGFKDTSVNKIKAVLKAKKVAKRYIESESVEVNNDNVYQPQTKNKEQSLHSKLLTQLLIAHGKMNNGLQEGVSAVKLFGRGAGSMASGIFGLITGTAQDITSTLLKKK